MRLSRTIPSAIAIMLTLTLLAVALAPPISAHAATKDKAFAVQTQPDVITSARAVVVVSDAAIRRSPEAFAGHLDQAANRLVRLQLKPAPINAPELIPKLSLANRSTGDIHAVTAATFYQLE